MVCGCMHVTSTHQYLCSLIHTHACGGTSQTAILALMSAHTPGCLQRCPVTAGAVKSDGGQTQERPTQQGRLDEDAGSPYQLACRWALKVGENPQSTSYVHCLRCIAAFSLSALGCLVIRSPGDLCDPVNVASVFCTPATESPHKRVAFHSSR